VIVFFKNEVQTPFCGMGVLTLILQLVWCCIYKHFNKNLLIHVYSLFYKQTTDNCLFQLNQLLMLQQTCLGLFIVLIKQSHVRKLPAPHNPDTRHRCERASHLFNRKFENLEIYLKGCLARLARLVSQAGWPGWPGWLARVARLVGQGGQAGWPGWPGWLARLASCSLG
jgi:hypothetical protein